MAESSMSLKTSFEQLEWHVKGGGKMALLVSRDLIRVTGQCIRLSKNSGRTLYRWNGEGEPLERRNHDERVWEVITILNSVKELMAAWSPPLEIPGSGTSVGGGNASNSTSVKIEPDCLLWIPFYQSKVVADGGSGRDTTQLDYNLSMCSWALNKHSDDEESDEVGEEAAEAAPSKIGVVIVSTVDGKTANVKVPSNMPVNKLLQNCIDKFQLPHANFAVMLNGAAVDVNLSLADAGLTDSCQIDLVPLE